MSESDTTSRPPGPGTRGSIRRWILAIGVMFFVGVIACGVLVLLHQGEKSYSVACGGNIFELGFRILIYEEKHGHFPPAHVDGPDGTRMHSWRILVSEDWFTGSPSPYRFDEPWDSAANSEYGNYRPDQFACPSDRATQRNRRLTNYFVVEGQNTLFPGSRTTTVDPTDRKGRANVILVVESSDLNVEWLKPRDLTFDGMSFVLNDSKRPSISSPHADGPHVVMADGSLRSLKGIDPEVLRAMMSYPAPCP